MHCSSVLYEAFFQALQSLREDLEVKYHYLVLPDPEHPYFLPKYTIMEPSFFTLSGFEFQDKVDRLLLSLPPNLNFVNLVLLTDRFLPKIITPLE